MASTVRSSCSQPAILRLMLWFLVGQSISILAGGVVNPCTDANLRAALNGGGTVTFGCDGTITLTTTLAIDDDSILDGTGHNVTISGNKSVRLFQVSTGITFTAKALTMSDGLHQGPRPSTIGGPAGNGFGAGILNLGGTVTLINCTLSNHVVQGGGGNPDLGGQGQGAAICSLGGEVNLTNCVLAGNLAKGVSVKVSPVLTGLRAEVMGEHCTRRVVACACPTVSWRGITLLVVRARAISVQRDLVRHREARFMLLHLCYPSAGRSFHRTQRPVEIPAGPDPGPMHAVGHLR